MFMQIMFLMVIIALVVVVSLIFKAQKEITAKVDRLMQRKDNFEKTNADMRKLREFVYSRLKELDKIKQEDAKFKESVRSLQKSVINNTKDVGKIFGFLTKKHGKNWWKLK